MLVPRAWPGAVPFSSGPESGQWRPRLASPPQCDVGTRSNGMWARCGSRELGGMPAESRGGACIRRSSICVPGQPPLVVVNQKNVVVSAGGDWSRASFPELAMRGSGMA